MNGERSTENSHHRVTMTMICSIAEDRCSSAAARLPPAFDDGEAERVDPTDDDDDYHPVGCLDELLDTVHVLSFQDTVDDASHVRLLPTARATAGIRSPLTAFLRCRDDDAPAPEAALHLARPEKEATAATAVVASKGHKKASCADTSCLDVFLDTPSNSNSDKAPRALDRRACGATA